MVRMTTMVCGVVAGVALVVAGLWACQEGRDLALDWGATRPDVAAWAIRSAAIAAIALAQVLFITCVTARIFRRRVFDDVLGFAGGVVFALATVTAVACEVAGR